MSKLYEVILKGVLIVLFFVGVAFSGSVIRSNPLLPISLLLISLLLGFLFFKVPDFFGDGAFHSIMKCMFYFSVAVAFVCLVFESQSVAYIEKFFFGGKVKHYDVEVDTDQGIGSSTSYYLEGVNSTIDIVITIIYWISLFGIPYSIYKMRKKN